ncbi:acyltransferase [Akkermansiaceae bacterium]|nr:acyltransferase [Akkermansiaceae bacterium]MDB0056920.1 acyltransferase [Akkermansiaceae bacterium]MDB4282181.1 acyltransferase [Akkermansiaceae bacterium]MDB4804674.1 acyltransferase [Akkermansiaceae bacterium]MDC0286851.1 acyltransferase [Akkermansiaceae bacterium]
MEIYTKDHPTHIKAHTGLRGIAAVSVITLHIHFDLLFPDNWIYVTSFLTAWFPVDVFFILSGFILGYMYVDATSGEKGLRNSEGYRSFYWKRFARIYPLHLLTIVLAGVMALMAVAVGLPNRGYYLSDLPSQLLLIHTFPYIELGGWNHPSWSISMEMLAYILAFPILVKFWKNRSDDSITVLVIVALSVLWVFFGHGTSGWGAVTRVLTNFTIGFAIFKLSESNGGVSKFCTRFVTYFLFAYLVFYISTRLIKVDSLFRAGVLHAFLIPVILGTVRGTDKIAAKLLGCRLFVWFGVISYSIYMMHTLFGKVINATRKYLPESEFLNLIIGGVTLAAIFVVSSLVYRYFEIPLRNWITTRTVSRHPKPIE